MSKYGVFSGPYFPVFSPNKGKCGPEKTPYLGTSYAVKATRNGLLFPFLVTMILMMIWLSNEE